jgi:hypothetical protein
MSGMQMKKALESAAHLSTVPSPVLPSPSKKQADIAHKKKLVRQQIIRKRWQQEARAKRRGPFRQMLISCVLAVVVLFLPVLAGTGLATYNVYNHTNALAHDSINRLLKVKSILNISKADPIAALNANKLRQAQVEFEAAESDFLQLQQLLGQPYMQETLQFALKQGNILNTAQSLIQVGLDVSRMGSELCGIGLIAAGIIHSSPLATGSTKPLITVSDVSAIEGGLVHALYYISDIRLQLGHISIKTLPISNAQKDEIRAVWPLLPKAESIILQAQNLIAPAFWLLGVGQSRRFLIQTLDTAELRPGGGFTGQYGILQIQDGRMSHLSLTDVNLLDYAGNGEEIGRKPPSAYSWETFPNWGVRDSNLSSDFPTTARMTIQLFEDEGGGPVDGDIAFTPTLIGHIIDITGPIKVPAYNEVITSKNLEDRLHYYQQDFSAIAREKQISGNYSSTGRKAFTSTLAQLLLEHVRHLSTKQLLELGKQVIRDIQSRDLEIYFTNPVAETWLVEHGYASSIATFSNEDGFIISQGNFSISKASQYVHTTEQDTVTLDGQGDATHKLTITLNYQQTGPVYGYDTYADYIRVYAPQSARFISGDGFDTGQVLCNPATSSCGQYNSSFPGNERYCPDGNYSLGIEWATTRWPIDSLGPPTEMKTDLPGRAMWGGWTLTPKNCISYITLSWVVPHAVQQVNGQPTYTILIQKQSGVTPTLELTIDASAIKGLKTFQFKGDVTTDKAFVLTPQSNNEKA